MLPDPTPKVDARRLPRSELQARKLGLMVAHLMATGYTIRTLADAKKVHKTNPDVFAVVEHAGVPVATLAFMEEHQIGFKPTSYGLQFIYDTGALTKGKHWPSDGPLFEAEESEGKSEQGETE